MRSGTVLRTNRVANHSPRKYQPAPCRFMPSNYRMPSGTCRAGNHQAATIWVWVKIGPWNRCVGCQTLCEDLNFDPYPSSFHLYIRLFHLNLVISAHRKTSAKLLVSVRQIGQRSRRSAQSLQQHTCLQGIKRICLRSSATRNASGHVLPVLSLWISCEKELLRFVHLIYDLFRYLYTHAPMIRICIIYNMRSWNVHVAHADTLCAHGTKERLVLLSESTS